MELDKALYFASSHEWRQWLEQNHDKETEAWLVHYRRASGKPSVSYPEALDEALCYGWIDGKLKSIDAEKYAIRYTPRKANSIWSKVNKEKAEKLVTAGRMTAAGLGKIDEAKRNGYWDSAYTNKVKERMPSDLKKALTEDAGAWSNFQRFANSYRNMYIGWVNGAKTEQTRKRRIEDVVRQAKLNRKLRMEYGQPTPPTTNP